MIESVTTGLGNEMEKDTNKLSTVERGVRQKCNGGQSRARRGDKFISRWTKEGGEGVKKTPHGKKTGI